MVDSKLSVNSTYLCMPVKHRPKHRINNIHTQQLYLIDFLSLIAFSCALILTCVCNSYEIIQRGVGVVKFCVRIAVC